MSDDSSWRNSRWSLDRVAVRLGRRSLLASAFGATVAGVGLINAGPLRAAVQQTPELQALIDNAITLEAFAVTFYGAMRNRQDRMELTDEVKRLARTAQCEEEAHYNYFASAGATPRISTFTINRNIFKDQKTCLTKLAEIEEIFVGAHMAAARQFAAMGVLDPAEVAYQIGAIESQHLVLARAYLDLRPPNDRAFAKWLFRDVEEAVTAIVDAGFIDGNGGSYDYPGPIEINCRSVFGLVPETTSEQPPLDETPSAAPPEATPAEG